MQTEFEKDDQETDHSAHHHTHHHGHHEHHHHHEESDSSPVPFLLKYMLDHNNHHAEELHSLVHKLQESGYTEAAEATGRALDFYQQGNAELACALEALPQDNS